MDIGIAPEAASGTLGGGAFGVLLGWWLKRQSAFKRSIYARFTKIEEEIDTNALYASTNYVRRDEVAAMMQHVDLKIDSINKTIIDVLRDNSRRS